MPLAWPEAGLTWAPVCLCFQFEEDVEIGEEAGTSRRNSRLLVDSFSKRKVCRAPRQGACPYVPQRWGGGFSSPEGPWDSWLPSRATGAKCGALVRAG